MDRELVVVIPDGIERAGCPHTNLAATPAGWKCLGCGCVLNTRAA